MSITRKKYLSLLALLSVTTITLFSCGGGSSPSDPGTPTTMVTSFKQQLPTRAKGQQFINPALAVLGGFTGEGMAIVGGNGSPWTNTSTYIITLSQIPYVSGAKTAKDYCENVVDEPAEDVCDADGYNFKMDIVGNTREFTGNGLPSTPMGTFPVQESDPAYSYYHALPANLNNSARADTIGIAKYKLISTLPLEPVFKEIPDPISSLIVGVTLTGTVWHIEYANDDQGNWVNPINALPLDQCFGHPYNKQYHLHGYSWKCFPNQGTSGQSPVVGFALDGFPITGPRAADGHMMTNAELDQCHGTTSEITMPDDEGKKVTYHYVLNREYPYSVGCFRGTVDYGKALGSDAMAQNIDYGSGPPTSFDSFPLPKLR